MLAIFNVVTINEKKLNYESKVNNNKHENPI